MSNHIFHFEDEEEAKTVLSSEIVLDEEDNVISWGEYLLPTQGITQQTVFNPDGTVDTPAVYVPDFYVLSQLPDDEAYSDYAVEGIVCIRISSIWAGSDPQEFIINEGE